MAIRNELLVSLHVGSHCGLLGGQKLLEQLLLRLRGHLFQGWHDDLPLGLQVPGHVLWWGFPQLGQVFCDVRLVLGQGQPSHHIAVPRPRPRTGQGVRFDLFLSESLPHRQRTIQVSLLLLALHQGLCDVAANIEQGSYYRVKATVRHGRQVGVLRGNLVVEDASGVLRGHPAQARNGNLGGPSLPEVKTFACTLYHVSPLQFE